MIKKFDVVIAGAGLAGLTAGLGCLKAGYSTAIIAPGLAASKNHPSKDGRTTALLAQSVEYLNDLGVWSKAADSATPLQVMRIIDDTQRLFRTPQLDFRAAEIGLDAFGYNIENFVLLNLLLKKLTDFPTHKFFDSILTNIEGESGPLILTTADGQTIKTEFLIGAEGRNSPTRQRLGGERKSWTYPQSALVTNFVHSLSHDFVSTEFHTPFGPFTTVPLNNNSSSLVWVDQPAVIEKAIQKPTSELNRTIERKMHSYLGKIELQKIPQSFPLSSMVARSFGSGRSVVIGEAAHIMPPIGAQGFNLGLRDVQEVIKLLSSINRDDWHSLGDRYHAQRAPDIQTSVGSVDILNQSLLSEFLPVQFLRSTGLSALNHIGPLRRFMMRRGVGRLPAHQSNLG